MARILVLGGGFGGISAALESRRLLGEGHEVTLVDDQGSFLMGLAKLWALDGRRSIEEGRRDLGDLERSGVRVVKADVESIDLEARNVSAGGKNLEWDRLVVALGARLVPEATPGFDAAYNLYEPDGITALADRLKDLQEGRLLFAVCGMPFKCPPAPYEAAMIAHGMFEKRGVRDRVEITLATPEPKPLPIAPAECSAGLEEHLGRRRIAYKPGRKPVRIQGDAGTVEFEDESTLSFDVLAAVPVHRVPDVVVRAGLAQEGGWVSVDPETLKTAHEDVWAIGDVNAIKTPVGKPLPKAGVFAQAQGNVVAHNIARGLEGREPDARFDGRGYCFIETGDGRATAIKGDFFAKPAPVLELAPPDAAAYEEKKRFEAERLKAWFGA